MEEENGRLKEKFYAYLIEVDDSSSLVENENNLRNVNDITSNECHYWSNWHSDKNSTMKNEEDRCSTRTCMHLDFILIRYWIKNVHKRMFDEQIIQREK